MNIKLRKSFAFLVLAYNHESYILEHLESIKYLVRTYAEAINVDLIINDDCSKDQTKKIVDEWLHINTGLFRFVKTLYNSKNLGTCASMNNMLNHVVADHCKLTAGDDVYSFENIFELTKCELDVAMISGRTLYLLGDQLKNNQMSNILATATQLIYKDNNLLHRFKHFSYNNAPNITYTTDCLFNSNVRAYINQYDVIEDWPIQIAIARNFSERRFELIDEVLVYYRRTMGSTYLVANQRFNKDKSKIYNDLIQSESKLIERLRLLSRKFCFNAKYQLPKKILNLDFYIYCFSFLLQAASIVKLTNSVNMRLIEHQNHYFFIKSQAMQIKKLITIQSE